MEEVTLDSIILRSSNDKHRIRIAVGDDGSLLATVLVRNEQDPDQWKPQGSSGTKMLAQKYRDSNLNLFHLR
jgi:hypothetical protein